ncbi:sugar-binding protein [Thiolinea disciformis]|uniref:sugar-binding protein n=1 Tax=Thiolinea disciformis TaxID=125614 RepID=UPI00047589FA|nr:sugar-binding protein [Thiolinea disciformis]
MISRGISQRGRMAAAMVLIVLQALLGTTAHGYYNANSAMGSNTNEVLEYDSSVPFIDLFKASLPFRESVPFLTKGQIEYDDYGWPKYIAPGAQAGTRLVHRLPAGTIPRGYYIVLYQGEGKIEYGLDASLVESQPGRDVILIDPGKDNEYSVKLEIKATNPNNYIRNIHVVPEGGICASNPFRRVSGASQCERRDYLTFEHNHAKIIFNPDYLTFMKDYKVIRFMNMSGITRNPTRAWSDRNLVEQATWGGSEGVRGAPLEVMVELANRLNADPWFNIPHAADNDYVRRYAEYVRAHLNPNLKIYLEYSNETWNGIFSQHAYMKQGGQQLNLDPVPHVAGYKFYSQRSVEIFGIFEQVFGGKERLVRLMAGLTGNPEMTQTMLAHKDAFRHTDAFAIAPYITGNINDLRRSTNVNDIFRAMMDKKAGHSLPRVLEFIGKQSALTEKFGVDLIAYEGGQHLIDDATKTDTQHPNPLFAQANRHPQMGSIYKQLLAGWKQAGGKMFVHFSSPRTYGRFGYVGTKEYITQPDAQAPKQQAIASFIKANPCWWTGCSSNTLTRREKPRALSMVELAQLNGDQPVPLPNSLNEKAALNNVPKIPNLDPITTAPSVGQTPREPNFNRNDSYRPLLVSVTNPPAEKYVFGNKAIAFPALNPADPLRQASTYQLRKLLLGRVDGKQDLAAVWQASWDSNKLYLRVVVGDDQNQRDSRNLWDDDSVEIFLDGDASLAPQYDRRNDLHLQYRWGDDRLTLGPNSAPVPAEFRSQRIDGKFMVDVTIPWTALGVQPRAGHTLGIDVHVNDDDDGQGRDGKLAWASQSDTTWRDPSRMGLMVLGQPGI